MLRIILVLVCFAGVIQTAKATTCAGATPVTSLPFSGALNCGGANNINNGNSNTCGNGAYMGGNEALYSYTPAANQNGIYINYNGNFYSGIWLYSGCPTSGGTCLQSTVTNGTTNKTLLYGGVLTAGTTYYILVDIWSGWAASPCPGTINITAAGNSVCAAPTPICSGTPITFTANAGGGSAQIANPGNNYSCLTTTPNPSWFYLQIANPGQLTVDISAGSDVDYAIWGPYANLGAAQSSCNSYPLPTGCSYSPSPVEQVNIPGTLTGQVYILLVTNFANTVQNITVNNAGGSATTDCSIVPLPVGMSMWDLYVSNQSVNLEWRTESEHHNSHFVIERSGEGKIWETIGAKKGFGNSEIPRHYSFRDEAPLVGVSYYRLRQVDTDGKYTFSEVLSANTFEANRMKVYPNPSNGEFSVVVQTEDVSEAYITDISGQIYRPEVSDTGNTLKVNTTGLKKGMYQLVLVVDDQQIITPIAIN